MKRFFVRTLMALSAIFALSFSLSGCTAAEEEGAREIRIDAFSHYWATSKARGRAVGSTRIIVTRDSAGPGEKLVDTLRLLDLSQNKTSTLPAHSVGRFGTGPDSSMLRLFYIAESQPRDFSCYLQSTGKRVRQTEDPDADDAFLGVTSVSFFEGEPEEAATAWLYFVGTTPTINRIFDCGYAPGKGFYLGLSDIDWYADNPNYAGSEIVIRY